MIAAAALAAAACGSSGNTVTAPSSLSKCAVTVDVPATTVPATGGGGAITVQTERECQWTAQPEVNWLSITAGSSGQGGGSIQFNAGANADPSARTGGVMVNGQRAQITQAAGECHFELSTTAVSFPQAGGNGGVDVRASSALCTWTAGSDAPWVRVTSNANGKGTATVTFTVDATTGPPRTATLTLAGVHVGVTQSEGCTYAIAPSSYSAGAAGGSQVIAVTGGAGCPWTASSNANWITVATPSGIGNGTVGFTVAPTGGPSRTGTLTIAGQIVTVTQSPGCSFDVSPLSHTVDAGGGTRTINVNTASGCEWTASSSQPWIVITSGATGGGSGTVTINVAAASGPSRSGTVLVAGQTVTIAQGNGCTFAISPDTQSVPSSGGNVSVAVTAPGACAWTATSNFPWITIASGASGNGNGTVSVNVAGTTGPGRSGTVAIAGRTFTINQGQGCTFSLSATSATAPATGGNGTFDVRTADGCGWAGGSNASWLTITGSANGSGNGTVHYTAAANTGPPRTGTMTAGGQTFTVTQAVGCSYSISPQSQNVATSGGNVSVTVNAPGGCTWDASSTVPWITIAAPSSGSGSGAVQVAVAANADAERRGAATIAGQTFTVVQASGCSYSLSPGSQSIPAAGGGGSFAVNASGSCSWSAVPSAPWISLTSAPNGAGPGTVQFAVASNPGGTRTGSIAVGGQTFGLTQDSGCAAGVSPDTIAEPAGGGPQNVSITTAADCAWTAASNVPWITIAMPASGAGNANVRLDIQPNTDAARSGTATIAGRVVTVNQDSGCTVSLSPTGQLIPSAGGTGSVGITTGAGCAWSVTGGAEWITLTTPASGSGSGSVGFSVSANATGQPRSATLTIGGQVFTVNQNQ